MFGQPKSRVLIVGACGKRVETVAFYEGTKFQDELLIGKLSTAYPFLLTVSQSQFEEILGEHLERRYKRKIKWSHRVAGLSIENEHVRAQIERLGKETTGAIVLRTEWEIEKTFHANYEFVIGADGYDSVVRRTLDVPWNVLGPAEQYALFETTATGGVDEVIRIVFDGPYSSILLPVERQRWQWAFQVPVDQKRRTREKGRLSFDESRDTDRREFAELGAQRAPWFVGKSDDVVWSEMVRFERRLAGPTKANSSRIHTRPHGSEKTSNAFLAACQRPENSSSHWPIN